VVPVSGLQVLVLEKRGSRQDDVGVVGGVGEKLLVHYGEQVRAQQPAHDGIVIGSNRCGIGVVHE
jgi:hypothetical protein